MLTPAEVEKLSDDELDAAVDAAELARDKIPEDGSPEHLDSLDEYRMYLKYLYGVQRERFAAKHPNHKPEQT